MNIGIVCYPTFGGSGVLATELGIALSEKGHNIHFISYRQPVRLESGFHPKINVHEVRPRNYPLFEFPPYELTLITKIIEVVKFEKLDILHVHYAIPHAFSAYNAKLILASEGINIPVVTTLHGTDVTLVGKDASVEPVITYAINQSDAITAVSHYLKEETLSHFKVNKDIEVIYNFVDLKKFQKKDFNHFKISTAPNNEPIITHTSNFRKVKRVEDAIYAFQKIREKMPAKLLLVGDGPERSNMESLCRKLKLCDDIRFLGKVNSVEDVLSISDLFLLPSESESFGLAALEAMACECPVVSSNAGGLPEVNINGETGFLAEIGDIEGLANACLNILTNPELTQQMRKNAFERAKVFELANIMPKYEALYESLLVGQD
ncbi:MAG: N-acetyl-alpha-D-glucosaminyl L-malate synthase BshA [Bacteroidetes bacterium]|nr:N-acetyl-alpha-D-glucosaminyl L-malate synthase BshA [Bacteroidota bacterium]